MAFGQAAGPPAGMRQIEELAALLERAGFSSFREARHPYGLTQRQAGGKFTVSEADELIERLNAAETVNGSVGPAAVAAAAPASGGLGDLGDLGDDVIVAELERRGWCCIPPLQDPPTEPG